MFLTLVQPAMGRCFKQCLILSTPSALGARTMSSGSSVVDQMLQYVWSDLKGQGQPAIDVLRSGLSMQSDPSAGPDSARLHLALAEVFAAEHDWVQAASSSQAAAAATAGSSLTGLAGFQATRALLVAGRDQESLTWTSSSSSSSPIHAAQQLMAHHASGATADHLQQQLQAQLGQSSSSDSGDSSSGDRVQGVLMAISHKVAGDMTLAQGSCDAAASSYQAANQALAAAAGSSDSSVSGSFTPDASSGLSPRFLHEVAADVALGAAQAHMLQKQWDASEEQLSFALKSAEAAAGESSPMLAAVLLLLASVYSRQARVMFAEGMCREAAKMLGATEPQRLVDRVSSSSHQAVHPSLAAAVSWRYCQLLTALPNRTAEAAAWGAAAKQLWARGRFCGNNKESNNDSNVTIEAVLGDDVALKGQGSHGHGKGAVVGLMLRRLLPMLTDSSTELHQQ